MKINLIIYLLLLSFLFPVVKPENNSTINYTHVLFEWDEIIGADSYQLVVEENNQVIIDTVLTNFFYIDKININWNTSYIWQVCEYPGSSNCSGTYNFSTGTEIDLGELNLTVNDSDLYYDGITIFGNLTPAFSAAIDKNGNQIWNSGGLNTFCYFKHDDQGRFFGGEYSTDAINILPGIEFDIDGNIVFEEPEIVNLNYAFVQHEILKISDNQYLFFIPIDEYHPVPVCATTPGCTDSDGEYYWEDDFADIGGYALWRGEKIILWNTDTNSIDWEWNAFDHIPLTDFDAIINWSAVSTFGYYDWTHFNALEYDPNDNSIYLSSRHLSRIYKIALNSYDDISTDENETIIWSMGYDPMGNGNVNIDLVDENGDYNGFSFQHGLQMLDNGNLVTLDNGNISSLLFDNYEGNNKTRALEISINESGGTAEIVWEYVLEDYLYGALSGNVQKVSNGNYLITTIGDYGHTLEINGSGEVISDLQYKIDNYVTGKMYRADRIQSLYALGCTDMQACNYDENARENDGSCEYPVQNCSCGSIDTDNDGVCDDEDACPNNSDPYQNDNDGDGLADACIDTDDDGDGLLDCWNFAIGNYPNTIYFNENDEIISNQQIDSLITVGSCGDFALKIGYSLIPNQIILSNAYPNPFNPLVKFDISIYKPTEVHVNIYSLKGELIDSIYSGHIVPGTHSFEWNGYKHPTGLYFINLTWDNNSINQKVVLLK